MRVYLLTNFDAPTIGSFNPGTVPFNWFEKGYARLNQEVVSQAASVTFGPADFNERARRLTYAPPGEPVPAGQVPGFYGAELGLWPGLNGALPTMDPAALAALKNLGLAVEANYPGVPFSFYGQWSASNGAPGLAHAQVQLSAADIFPRLFKFRFVSIQLLPISLAGESLNTWLMANATRDPADATPYGWLVSPYYNDSTLQPELQFQAELDWVLARAQPQDFLIVATNYAATDYLPSVHGQYFDAIADAGFAVVKVSEAGGTGGGGGTGSGAGGTGTADPLAAHPYCTEVYNKILSLLSSRQQFSELVRAGNVIDYTAKAGKSPYPDKPANAKGRDFPAVYFQYDATSIRDSAFSDSPTFSTESVEFDPATDDFQVIRMATHLLRIVGSDPLVTVPHQILEEVMAALDAAGPRLGLAYAMLQPITVKSYVSKSLPECAGHPRRVVDMSIPVQLTLYGRELVAA